MNLTEALGRFSLREITMVKCNSSNYTNISEEIKKCLSILQTEGVTHFVDEIGAHGSADFHRSIRAQGMKVEGVQARALDAAVEGCFSWGGANKVVVLTGSPPTLANNLRAAAEVIQKDVKKKNEFLRMQGKKPIYPDPRRFSTGQVEFEGTSVKLF